MLFRAKALLSPAKMAAAAATSLPGARRGAASERARARARAAGVGGRGRGRGRGREWARERERARARAGARGEGEEVSGPRCEACWRAQ
jgi:hypothetical protein